VSAGRLSLLLSEGDINRFLDRLPRGGLAYSQGVLLVEQPLPVGGTATCIAVPFQHGQELHIAVPFDKIKGTGLGFFAGALARTFWGALSGRLQSMVDEQLLRRGMPPEAVTIALAHLRDGKKGGLVRISLPHLNAWLAARTPPAAGLSFALSAFSFTAEHVGIELLARPAVS
jgi:hypothetical protein